MLRSAVSIACFAASTFFVHGAGLEFQAWAATPPMGWNSWDTFATTITEAQAKAETDYMAEHLLAHGWQYMVVDIQWYEPGATGFNYRKDAKLIMDEYGRLQPAPNRFPSSANGAGFKALADYVHAKGLKFGIHMMRGIAKQAVAANTPIFGSSYHAADIADPASTCKWNPDMYGVDMSKPGAQDYYNAEFQQYADFVKIDDLSRPYHQAEIEAIRMAIDKTGRPMVFSTSPGETPVNQADHILAHANMWRISDDFWDNWKSLRHQVDLTEKWAPYLNKGGWPDCDMLPLGVVRQAKAGAAAPAADAHDPAHHSAGWTHFTPDEQRFLMTLWVMARSPLIFGGDLLKLDPDTLALITNDDVLAIDQHSTGNRPLFHHDTQLAWTADVPQSHDKYLAVFNLGEKAGGDAGAAIPVDLSTLGFTGAVRVHDLWSGQDLPPASGTFSPVVPWHGAELYRVSAKP
jgi:alpha-galactosidase